MVHAQESAPGKLIFRHPLSLSDLSDEKWPNFSSDEWSSVTRIATSYNHFTTCSRCKNAQPKIKFALVTPSCSNPRPGSDQLIRLGLNITRFASFFSYYWDGEPTTVKWLHPHRRVSDFIMFNGQIYGCEYNGVLYVLDHMKVELIPLIPACNIACPGTMFLMRLAVWDGGLYAVVMYTDKADCYRLVEDEGNCRWEKVEDQGGGVLFITSDCVFSMSATDLPPPWIVVAPRTGTTCCIGIILVYELGVEGGKSKPISSIPGYSKLFAPPLTRS